MPLDDHQRLLLAETYRSPGMQVLRELLKDFKADYAASLGKHLTAGGQFDKAAHDAQVDGFKIANRLLNKAAQQAGAFFAPEDEDGEAA